MSNENPLLDGTLTYTVAGHDFSAVIQPQRTYDNTNPGGFGGATFRIEGTLAGAYSPFVYAGHTMAKGDAVVITHGSTPVTLYSGEITGDVSHATIEGGQAFYDVTCAGLWWKAGQRGDFCQVWGDDDYGQWFELGTGGPFQVDTDGKVDIRLEAGQTAKDGSSKSLYYWLDNGAGDPAAELFAMFCVVTGNVTDKDSAQWHADISYSDSPWGTWTRADDAIWGGGSPSLPFVAYVGGQAIRLRLYVDNAASTGTTADRYIRLSKVSVITDLGGEVVAAVSKASPAVVTTMQPHTLKSGDRVFVSGTSSVPTVDGWRTVDTVSSSTQLTFVSTNVATTAQTSPSGSMYFAQRVDSALADIASATGLATSTDLQTGGVGNINWGLNVRPHTTRAEAIEMIVANHPDPLDYGFWDDSTFYCKERIAASGSSDILIDSTAPGIDFAVYADTEDSPTHVKVEYMFRDTDDGTSVYPTGTLTAVYRPSAPTWGDASVVLDVWDQWSDLVLETQQAADIGDQILAWVANNKYTGTVTIATPTVPLRAGGTKVAAYIRAGDYIEDTNLDTGPLQISSVDVDVDSGVVTLGIGETVDEFLERMPAQKRKRVRYRKRVKGKRVWRYKWVDA